MKNTVHNFRPLMMMMISFYYDLIHKICDKIACNFCNSFEISGTAKKCITKIHVTLDPTRPPISVLLFV
jgi:hypothetical protein